MQKWTEFRRRFQVGEAVLPKETSDRNDWPMGRIKGANANRNGFVWQVTLYLRRRDDNDTRHSKDL